MTTATYESTVLLGTTSYRVVASADPDLVVELTGVDTSGAQVAEGALRLPADAGVAVGRLLGQVLGALGRLGARGPTGRERPANANQPWSGELDGELRAAWLEAEPGTTAAELVRVVARGMGRSAWSIRARLARVGCDPDVPGRVLSPAGAGVLGAGELVAAGVPPPVGTVTAGAGVGAGGGGMGTGAAGGGDAAGGGAGAGDARQAGAGSGVSQGADQGVVQGQA